jgi:hypothetical protein
VFVLFALRLVLDFIDSTRTSDGRVCDPARHLRREETARRQGVTLMEFIYRYSCSYDLYLIFWSCRELNSPTLERTEVPLKQRKVEKSKSREAGKSKNRKDGKSKSGKTESGKFPSCLLQDDRSYSRLQVWNREDRAPNLGE